MDANRLTVLNLFIKLMIRIKNVTTFLLLILQFNNCSSQEVKIVSSSFNEDAKSFFLNNFDSLDLDPLDEIKKCILKEIVINDLDELNDWSITLVNDNYQIRNYFDSYLNLHFSFVKDDYNNFYFFSLPNLDDYMYNMRNYYYKKNDSVYLYNGPVKAIRLHTPLVDDFYHQSSFVIDQQAANDFREKVALARHILEKTQMYLNCHRTSIGSVVGTMEDRFTAGLISKEDYYDIIAIVQQGLSFSNHAVDVFTMKHIGTIIVVYYLDNSSKLRVDFYFVPEKERVFVSGSDQVVKYRDCFSAVK